MNVPPGTGMQHPLVTAYLDDLDSALAGADPRERAETLDGVREHIREALAARQDAAGSADPTTGEPRAVDAVVRSVLAQLGPVEPIAASAGAGPSPASAPRRDPVPGIALGVAVVALALVVPVPWLAAALALGVLVASLQLLRTSRRGAPLLRAAAVVSGVCLVLGVVLAATLLSASSGPSSPSPVQGATAVSG